MNQLQSAEIELLRQSIDLSTQLIAQLKRNLELAQDIAQLRQENILLLKEEIEGFRNSLLLPVRTQTHEEGMD